MGLLPEMSVPLARFRCHLDRKRLNKAVDDWEIMMIACARCHAVAFLYFVEAAVVLYDA